MSKWNLIVDVALEVVLERGGRGVGRATTDTFGEFIIDRLEPNSSGYQLKAAGPAGKCSTQFDLAEESRYLGVMTLTREKRFPSP